MTRNQSMRLTKIRIPSQLLILACVAFWGTGCGKLPFAQRREREAQHADEPPMESVTLAAAKLELFMEHPYLVARQPAKFNVHLTVMENGMPIRGGTLTVIAKGPSGKTFEVQQPAPRSPGIFGPVVAFPEAGQNEFSLTLDSEQAKETIRVPITVYDDDAIAKNAADAAVDVEPEDAIKFLKEQAWKVGVVHEPVVKRQLVERLVVPGQVTPAAGAKAVVTPPIGGRVLRPAQGSFPRVGQLVKAGDALAVIEPQLAGPQGVELTVNRAQIQSLETELAVKQLEVEVEITKAKVAMEYAQQVASRAKSLSTQGATAKKQAEEAEHELRLAAASYDGKLKMLKPYELAREELRLMHREGRVARDDLRSHAGSAHSAANPKDDESPQPAPSLRITLRAAVSGTVTAAQATEGEFVDATKPLFTIINMNRLWIEAQVSEYDLERVAKAPSANFSLAAYPNRTFTILGRNGGQLIDIGLVVDTTSRTVPVRYEVSNSNGMLRVGMFAEVAIETSRIEQSVAIPASAIVDEDGRPTAYVLLDGESFQKRDLELGIRDSGFIEVKKGIGEGERVVTKGAYAIRLASVSAVIPAHGHTH